MGEHNIYALRVTVGDTTVEASSSASETLYRLIEEGMNRVAELATTAKR